MFTLPFATHRYVRVFGKVESHLYQKYADMDNFPTVGCVSEVCVCDKFLNNE